MHEGNRLLEMLLQLATDRLLVLATHPGVVREAYKGGGVLANVQIHATDLLRWHSKHPPRLELGQLPRLGQLARQDHGQEEADGQQHEEHCAPASSMPPMRLHRRFHHTKAPMIRILSRRNTSGNQEICLIYGLVCRM